MASPGLAGLKPLYPQTHPLSASSVGRLALRSKVQDEMGVIGAELVV